MKKEFTIPDEKAMLDFGGKLARLVQGGIIIYLYGDLGAGKTTLVRGFLRELGYQGKVKSPTYTLVESYQLNHTELFHFDLYRVVDPEELEFMGIRDYFTEDTVCFVEWPDKGGSLLPEPDLCCYIQNELPGRKIVLVASSLKAQALFQQMM